MGRKREAKPRADGQESDTRRRRPGRAGNKLQSRCGQGSGGVNPAVVRDRVLTWGDLASCPKGRRCEAALVFESENFANPSHGNPWGRHLDLLLHKKGARVPGRLVELPRTAPSIPTFLSALSTMLNAIPSILNGIPTSPPKRSRLIGNRVQHRRNRVHVPSEISFSFGRNTQNWRLILPCKSASGQGSGPACCLIISYGPAVLSVRRANRCKLAAISI